MRLPRFILVALTFFGAPAFAQNSLGHAPGFRPGFQFLNSSIAPVFQADFTSLTPQTMPSQVSFSRASNATMYDSTGKLTYAPNNLLTYSNTFSNAAWDKGGSSTVTSGQADPLGGTNGWRLQGAGSWYLNNNSVTYGGQTLISLWIKSNTASSQTFRLAANSFITSTSNLTATTSWQQFSFIVSTNPNGGAGIWRDTSNNSVDLLIYAATASAITYETTPRAADQVITTTAAYYGPRFNYDPSTLAAKGLLIEESRTNSALQSRDLSNAAWTTAISGSGAITVTANAGADRAGLTTATRLTVSRTSNTDNTGRYQSFTGTAGMGSCTFWVKAWSATDIGKILSITPYNGTAIGTRTNFTLTNSWQAITCTALLTASATCNYFIGWNGGDGLGTGTVDFLVTDAQFELGAFATSTIPTAGATVTRSADIVQLTGTALAALQGSAATALFETDTINGNINSASIFGQNNNWQPIQTSDATHPRSYNGTNVFNGNVFTGNYQIGVVRTGLAWDASSRSLVANGATVASNTGGVSLTAAYLGQDSGGDFANTWFRKLAIYNSRLPDATLQSKSVVGAPF